MAQESGSSESPKWRLNLHFPSNAPVFGCRFQPYIHVVTPKDSFQFPPHENSCTWYQEHVCSSSNQEKVRCFVHHDKLSTTQCRVCVGQNRHTKISYYCSNTCYMAAWNKHKIFTFKSQLTVDGCATFYRNQRFKEIATYELEFNNSAKPFVDSLDGEQKNEALRLLKDNVALVVILEMVENEGSSDGNRPRICVVVCLFQILQPYIINPRVLTADTVVPFDHRQIPIYMQMYKIQT